MTVFKTFFRLLKKNMFSIILPLIIFLAISLAISSQTRTQTSEFQKKEAVVVFINRGEETVLSQGLRQFIDENMSLLELDEKFIEDAIFYRQADFVAILETDGTLNYEMIYDANFAYLAKQDINQFCNDIDIYRKYQSNLSEEEIVERVLLDAQEKVAVQIVDTTSENTFFVSSYFNALSYIVMLLVFGVIGKNLLIFNSPILVVRSSVSSLSQKKQGLQLFLASSVILHILWLIASIVTYLLIQDKIHDTNVLLYFVNLYVFFWCILAMSFLLSRIISSESVLSASTTGLSLGLAFISGSFIPQAVLSSSILAIAKISPVYWMIEINQLLGKGVPLSELILPFAILVAFTLVFVLVALIISRQKRMSVLDLT